MVRAYRIRQRQRSLEGAEGEAGCLPFFCRRRQKPQSDPKISKQSFARRHVESVLGAFRRKGLDVESEKKKPQDVEARIPSTEPRQNRNSGMAGNATQSSVPTPPVVTAAAHTSRIPCTPLPQQSERLEVREIAEGSLRKLEQLTGTVVVPAPLAVSNNIQERSTAVVIQSARSNVTEDATTYASTDQWSPHTSLQYPDIGDIVTPLTAPPPPNPVNHAVTYPNITALSQASRKTTGARAKRVSFTYDNYMTHHIATQYNPTGQRQSFPQKRTFNHKLPPLPSASKLATSRYVVYGGYDETEGPTTTEKRLPPLPLPPIVIQPGKLPEDESEIRKVGGYNRHSWSGRSVLELDDSQSFSSESEKGQFLEPPRHHLQYRKPVPAPQENKDYELPTREAPRLTDSPQIRIAQIAVAPRVQSMVGDTIHIPIPQRVVSSPAQPMQSPSGSNTVSNPSTSTHRCPSPDIYGITPEKKVISSPDDVSAVAKLDSGVPGVRNNRYSLGEQSLADTVLTDNTVATRGTLTTEQELVLEMGDIRERAKRASVDRKAKRIEQERKEMEGKGKGKAREIDCGI